MFGVRFVKVEPTTYLMAFREGQVVREGVGLSCLYSPRTTSVVAVPDYVGMKRTRQQKLASNLPATADGGGSLCPRLAHARPSRGMRRATKEAP